MSPQQKAIEFAFNKRYSRFKLQVFFKNRPPVTHYGSERMHCTVSQILFGHVKEFTIHRDEGLKDCVKRIDVLVKLYGEYTAAIIYDNKLKTTLPDGSLQKGREIIKYVGGKCVEFLDEEQIFSISPKKIKVKTVKDDNGKYKILPVEENDSKPPEVREKEIHKSIDDLTKMLSFNS